ncbi:uncharacterized protein [Salvelinus alpinus]|uniref:uncharacterized protein isoform X2 n=1 Tax=Salvelinus alpinus TaxID=8036 RepID=UPI0039FC850C
MTLLNDNPSEKKVQRSNHLPYIALHEEPVWQADYLLREGSKKPRFICIYPSYVNSKKTLAEGRRIPAEKAVENPTCAEIRHVLTWGGGKCSYGERDVL